MRHAYTIGLGLLIALALPLAGTGRAHADPSVLTAGNQQAINYVIQRALSQRGVPYVYGGGNAAGPTRGSGLNANVVGFDASGLIQYAFAGAGIKMPRTSGQQCSVGVKVPPAQARPGDLICYGPGGSQSVAMYLGNGQMIEATEPAVTVSPARTAGMTPYLTRIIG
ncbi:NlpC/P60 family peptidoglycan-binding protein RipD [Mycobacterium sp. SM1]|uniref:NlpC/P60 family peptidoglycan-binding protein RipD n=1 Tax=Mycobacterium sp. SM1 TaxID=2816243 RepID=UPI001BD0AE9C|nr:NlpC/P60 family peptidoglycan-binding protein RipD [Mycobacterium sp. SM1]MBS4729583.1 NlpC/P60 family peptidoglycan-binding protein RipD [Mycobacterium sp. SM1]